MTVKELIERLQGMDPEAQLVTDFWNGHVDSYMAIDSVDEWYFSEIEADFFGTPGSVDLDVFCSKAKKVVFIGGSFEVTDKRVFYARRLNWRLQRIVRQHRSTDWKKERLYREVKNFDEDYERCWFDKTYGI